jgi:hypothetical protein
MAEQKQPVASKDDKASKVGEGSANMGKAIPAIEPTASASDTQSPSKSPEKSTLAGSTSRTAGIAFTLPPSLTAAGQKAEDSPPNKMQQATEIYKRMIVVKDVTRKDIIEKFVAEVKLTKAGASTYYQLIKAKQDPAPKK